MVDLDGTLIREENDISNVVLQSIRDLSTKISVSIATGRDKDDVLRFSRIIGLSGPQISENGALIIDSGSGETLARWTMDNTSSDSILHLLNKELITYLATGPGISIRGPVKEQVKASHGSFSRISALDMLEKDADALVNTTVNQSNVDAAKAFLPYNNLWAVDFTLAGINKASGAMWVADKFNLLPSEIIAVGDSYNDLSLLKYAGLSIAMGNAPKELISIADYVAPTVWEDGLAKAIDCFISPLIN